MKAEKLVVGIMAVGIVGLSILDAYLTTKIVVHGGGTELNPVMRTMLEDGTTDFWLLKIIGSSLAALLLYRIWKRKPRIGIAAFVSCLTVMAGVAGWNLFQII